MKEDKEIQTKSDLSETNQAKTNSEKVDAKPGFFQRFKTKWNIKNNFSLVLILIVFSINGSFAVWVAKPVLEFFGVDKETMHPLIFWPVRLALILPIYQFTLPIVGFFFGQFKFFWAFQKKTVGRMFGIK